MRVIPLEALSMFGFSEAAIYPPQDLEALDALESHVRTVLLKTLDINLRNPDRLREVTCQLAGFPNGYQQLQGYWREAKKHRQATREKEVQMHLDDISEAGYGAGTKAEDKLSATLDQYLEVELGVEKSELAAAKPLSLDAKLALVESRFRERGGQKPKPFSSYLFDRLH